MRQANVTQNEDTIEVVITKLGSPSKTLTLAVDSTVEEALAESDFSVSSNETIWVNGDIEANMADQLDDGDTIQLVGRKQGGRA